MLQFKAIPREFILYFFAATALVTSSPASYAQMLPNPNYGPDSFEEAFAPTVAVTVGKALTIPMRRDVRRVYIADPNIVDCEPLSNRLYIRAKRPGDTNLLLWYSDGSSEAINIRASVSVVSLRNLVNSVYPNESEFRLKASGSTILLEGRVADTVVSDSILRMAKSYASTLNSSLINVENSESGGGSAQSSNAQSKTGSKGTVTGGGDAATGEGDAAIGGVRVINLMSIKAPQQVQLEVRIAEVSRVYLEKIGFRLENGISGQFATNFLSSGTDTLGLFANYSIEANRNRGAVRMLAEPTLVAMSGTQAHFLVGGRVFLPTGRDNNGNVTLEAQNYGVGLTFQPTVLDNGRINLKVAPEVSSYLGGGNFTSTVTSTTVEIAEGESLIIGGLINKSSMRSGDAVPILGEIPILGALFRSKAFQKNETELVVVISPKLVASTKEAPTLPTDTGDTPSRSDFFLLDKP